MIAAGIDLQKQGLAGPFSTWTCMINKNRWATSSNG